MWASSFCPRTWTRRLWTLASSPTPALASMMPILSSTSSMVTWSRVLTALSPSLPRSVTLGLDQRPGSCRSSWLGAPSGRRWDPKTRPSPASKACLHPSKASCQQRGSRLNPGEWKGSLGPSAQAKKALLPTEQGRLLRWLRGPGLGLGV